MFIGHAPAGYVVSKLLFHRFRPFGVSTRAFLWCGVAGAIAPDLDMLYFHLADHRQHHHHTYISHFPIIWLTLLFLSSTWLRYAKNNRNAALATIFSLNGFIHMLLDTITGDIWWFAPLVDKPFALFSVPAIYKPWWLNFLLHWTFAFEVAVLAFAIYLWRQRYLLRAFDYASLAPEGD